MEYNIKTFVDRVREVMYDNFPTLPNRGFNPNGTPKHGQYNREIRDVAFMDNATQVLTDDMVSFDIGNEYAEEHYPYYHILEDAPVIHKRDRGTEESKGSQGRVANLGQRDYGIVTFNGKSFSKEYAKNVRGSRASVVDRATRFVTVRGVRYKYNADSNVYKNVHYHYIEKMLEIVVPLVAQEFGLEYVGVSSTGLAEEYGLQEYGIADADFVNQILNI